MNEVLLDAEIGGIGRMVELGAVAEKADRAAWGSAREALGEWKYGPVRVRAEWPAARGAETLRLPLRVSGTSDAATYAELFLHDAFLMFNLAAPGSFGGTVSLAGAGEMELNARVFEYAWATTPEIEPLSLAQVAAWYGAQRIDAARPATTPLARALFHLLHLARNQEDELLAIVRLARAAEALGVRDEMLFAMRDAIVRGDAAVMHPAADDDEESLDRIDVADAAAGAIVRAIQERIPR